MTDDRKICKRCRCAVTLIDPEKLYWFCKNHGTLRWWLITHGVAAGN